MPDTPSIALLRRLRQWDMFSIPSGDNEYWTAEIDKVIGEYDASGYKLVDALKMARIKAREIENIVGKALALPE